MKFTAFYSVLPVLLLLSITDLVLTADTDEEISKENIFWSFKEPVKQTLSQPSTWGVNEIDSFIFERLKVEDLLPQRPASKEEWIRRVSLDLTGLPATTDEIDAFISDRSDQAFERVVERLLG